MMKQAQHADYQTLVAFYKDVIARTPHIGEWAQWGLDKHPTEGDIRSLIEEGKMYFLEEDGILKAAMVFTLSQGEDYRPVKWDIRADDDEVATIHLLGVNPDCQGQGIGSRMIDEAVRKARAEGKKALRLDVLTTNGPARKLYERLGFRYQGSQRLNIDKAGWLDFDYLELGLL